MNSKLRWTLWLDRGSYATGKERVWGFAEVRSIHVSLPAVTVERAEEIEDSAIWPRHHLSRQGFYQGSQLRKTSFHRRGKSGTMIEAFATQGNGKSPRSSTVELLSQGKNTSRRKLVGGADSWL